MLKLKQTPILQGTSLTKYHHSQGVCSPLQLDVRRSNLPHFLIAGLIVPSEVFHSSRW